MQKNERNTESHLLLQPSGKQNRANKSSQTNRKHRKEIRNKHVPSENIDIYSINETLRADPMKTKTKSAEQKGLYYMTGKLLNTIDLGYTAGSH